MKRNWCMICIIFTFIVFFTPLEVMAVDGESEQETVSTIDENEAPSDLPSENMPIEESSENNFNQEQSSEEQQNQEQPQENIGEYEDNQDSQDNEYEEEYIEEDYDNYDYGYYNRNYYSYNYDYDYDEPSSSLYLNESSQAVQNISPEVSSSSNIQNSTSIEPSSEQAINEMSSQLDESTQTLSVPQLLGTGIEIIGGDNKFVGLIAWFCVILGLAIVVTVLFSGKSKGTGKGFVGRKRYKSYAGASRKKRLLSDKYYNKTRYR